MKNFLKRLIQLTQTRKKVISMILAIFLLISILPMSTILAWSAPANVTVNKSANSSLFTNQWGTAMTTGLYYIAGTGELAYCLDQEGTGPGGTGYSLNDSNIPTAYMNGIRAIIQHGYPYVTDGLTNEEARYATQVAIHWIENYYLGAGQGYDASIRGTTNANGHTGALAMALALYDIGVNQITTATAVILGTPSAWSGGQLTIFADETDTTSWTISSLPAGVTSVGGLTFTGDKTLTLQLTDPAAFAASNKRIEVQGYSSRETSNIHVFTTSGGYQTMAAVSTQMNANGDPSSAILPDASGSNPTPPAGPTPTSGPTGGPTATPTPTGHGSVIIYKTKYALSNPSGTMAPESGATFGVYDSNGNNVDVITSNSSGVASSSHEYEMGSYSVMQMFSMANYFTFPIGYSLSFTIVEGEGQVFSFSASNIIYEQYIRILKTDSETGDLVRLAGATFEVLASDGVTVLSDSNGKSQFTTDSTGTIALSDLPLVVGGYFLKEIQAPRGYVINEALLPFSVSIFDHGSSLVTVENGKDVKNINFVNKPQKCEIQIIKMGDYLYSAEKREATDPSGIRVNDINNNLLTVYDFFYIAKEKTAATFEVTVGSKDIVDQDGNLKMYDTDKDGVAETPLKAGTSLGLIKLFDPAGNVMTNLPLDGISATAEYFVTETVAPFGDLLFGRGAWSFSYADQHIATIINKQSIYDTRQRLQVKIQKFKETGVWNAQMNDYDWPYVPAEGILFGLYTKDNIYGDLGAVQIPAGTLVDVMKTDSTGVAVTSKDLPFGSYYVKELNVTPDVMIDQTNFDVSGMPMDQTNAMSTVTTASGTQPFYDKAVAGKVNVYKFASDTKLPMPGVVFEVYDKDGNLVDKITTDAGGHAITKVLPYGQYILLEIKTITGYALADKQTININMSQLVQHEGDSFSEADFVLADQKMAQIEVYKVTGDGKQTPMNGVVFGVYDAKTNAEVARLTTDSKGYGSTYVKAGEYYMKEISTWEGYTLSAAKIPVSADWAAVYTFHETNSLTELRVLKTSTGGEALAGMQFTVTDTATGKLITFVYDQEKKAYVAVYVLGANKEMSLGTASKTLTSAITEKNGLALILGLKPGTYTVTETKAPDGYNLDSKPTDIVINGAGVLGSSIIIQDTSKFPKTGETGNDTFLIGAGTACVALAIATIAAIWKKKNSRPFPRTRSLK